MLELLVVLVILGLLAAIATPQAMKYLGRAKSGSAQVQISALANSIDLFKLDVGRYPVAQEGLMALVERPPGLDAWHGPYVKRREMLLDPWGNPYIYVIPGRHGEFDLGSLGADKAPGGDGENRDITSW